MDEADAKRLKALEKENTELKKMYAEAMLGIKILQETIEKMLWPLKAAASARSAGCSDCTARPIVTARRL
jgi:hypothetical protein